MRLNRLGAVLGLALAASLMMFLTASAATGSAQHAPVASGWTLVKFVQTQPACTGVGFQGAENYNRLECGFGYFRVNIDGTELSPVTSTAALVKITFLDRDGNALATQTTTRRTTAGSEGWQFTVQPGLSWPAGPVTIRVTDVDTDGAGPSPNQHGNFGENGIVLNALGARVAPGPGEHAPGTATPVNGNLYEIEHVSALVSPKEIPVAGTVNLQVRTPSGEVRGPYGPFVADAQGKFSGILPPSATAGISPTAATGFKTTVAIEAVDARYSDPATGSWASKNAGSGALALFVPPTSLLLENNFTSDVGWVKPGDTYPFRVFVRNYTSSAAANAVVKIPAPDGTTFTRVSPQDAGSTAGISNGRITWNIGTVPAATGSEPTLRTLVVEAKAKTLGQDPKIVWKNLSSTATLTYTAGPTLTSTSHGPKVIPQKASYDTARYGDRPFAVVTADYFDRKHEAAHTGESLREKINSPDVTGSTFNLYQEMSYGQLFPHGTLPAAGITTAGWNVQWKSDRFKNEGWHFSDPSPGGACYGTSFKSLAGSAVYPERIHDGWYQLPGNNDYYGDDTDSFGNVAAPNGGFIDNACGPIGKAVFDAAQIADPEIDYSDYDTDKDGVVDFFMLVFAGLGGNGPSQLNAPPYDNIWPHSSSLEFYYTDPATGQKGYVSDDQDKDLEGRPLYYTDSSRSQMTTTQTSYPVYVRVGPYNVNPESAIDRASVISHEYGHSLGLPDFYSNPGGNRTTYGDWMLMANDKSQNMDTFGKQELGWLVPRVLKPGQTTATGVKDGKLNTHRIDWQQPDGTPYTLTGSTVNNGEAYVAKLPGRRLIDPAKVPSGSHVWWSGSGDGFGCAPAGGHNLDISVPALKALPAGTPVTMTFKSMWDMEWDFDYGFVMVPSVDSSGNVTYQSLPSQNGYTTDAAINPNASDCQLTYGNGITGSSGSYDAGTQTLDRAPNLTSYPAPVFLTDSYDLTSFAGKASAIRFSYSTDPGVAHNGWYIDDLTITTGDGTVLYSSEFEDANDPAFYNGGCNKDGLSTSDRCTDGWNYIDASTTSDADHAYYMEMRDRSGYDMDGHGQNDRDPIGFLPGFYLMYTDESTGYGNYGSSDGDAPSQSPLDAHPEIGNETPNLNDAAFTAGTSFSDSVNAAQPQGWIDNYKDGTTSYADGNWHFDFNCLSFNVTRMTGNDIGPATAPGNLEGDVTFTLGSGCGAFDYGYGVANAAPTAVAAAKPKTVDVGDPVTLDGSASYDDLQASTDLSYSWDTDSNGTADATGRTVVYRYTTPGTYTVTLKVTDSGGLSSTATTKVTVRGSDLRVTGVSTSKQNGQFIITATVANFGAGKAAASKTRFRLDGSTLIALVDTPAIAAGKSVNVVANWSPGTATGQHTIAVTADSTGLVAETNESNNTASTTVTVG
jgi:immune inhibitor A